MESVTFFSNTDFIENELYSHGYEHIIKSPFLTRLKGVSFLSTIDYIYNVERPFSRYDHSLGSAYLALQLSKNLNLSEYQTKILVLANLIHDVGHSPFSHAAETFLLETKKKYHQGLVNSYLRYNTQLFPEAPGLKDILCDFSSEIAGMVYSLILNNRTNDCVVDTLHFCPFNCDKIDGTNRSFCSLSMKMFDPNCIISKFSTAGNFIQIKHNDLSLFCEFWKAKEELYNKYIYVYEVLVAEAMLTRSLELLFDTDDKVNFFITCDDKTIASHLNSDVCAKGIFSRMLVKDYFLPLSQIRPELFNEYKELFVKARFDKKTRERYELEISKKLDIPGTFVISHFSFKKQFYNVPSNLKQLNLFCNNVEFIDVNDLCNAFYKTKISGDVFEIFVDKR